MGCTRMHTLATRTLTPLPALARQNPPGLGQEQGVLQGGQDSLLQALDSAGGPIRQGGSRGGAHRPRRRPRGPRQVRQNPLRLRQERRGQDSLRQALAAGGGPIRQGGARGGAHRPGRRPRGPRRLRTHGAGDRAHEKAATQLVAPTHAAGALDVVGGDGFSALLWAEERGWDGVAQSLRECGAAAARRPALALFRGEAGAVQVDVEERTVAFAGSFATVRSAQRCPLGGKGYYEIEILERDFFSFSPHITGVAARSFT